jgi:23S rRNA pseudouridine1911/1915/1917 synthase
MEIKWTVLPKQERQSLQQVLRQQYGLSRRQLIRLKQLPEAVMINDMPARLLQRLMPGDRVEVTLFEHLAQLPPEPIPLEVIYEDDFLIVINKPAGLVSHPTKGYPGGTLANALSWHWQQRGQQLPARLVTRLDKDTSGLVLAAKTAWCHYRLSQGRMKKIYYAITRGIPCPLSGGIDLSIGRSPDNPSRRGVSREGKTSLTLYWTEAIGDNLALVRLQPISGRTHQLRIHMAHIGCPMLDDYMYGVEEGILGRTALHAYELEFVHPGNRQRMRLTADLPKEMLDVLNGHFLG